MLNLSQRATDQKAYEWETAILVNEPHRRRSAQRQDIYRAIIWWCSRFGASWMCQKEIAERCKTSPSAVKEAINLAESNDLIKVHRFKAVQQRDGTFRRDTNRITVTNRGARVKCVTRKQVTEMQQRAFEIRSKSRRNRSCKVDRDHLEPDSRLSNPPKGDFSNQPGGSTAVPPVERASAATIEAIRASLGYPEKVKTRPRVPIRPDQYRT